MYKYRAETLEVRDGDTIVARVDLGFDVSKRMALRLKDIYCPELDAADEEERIKAGWSKDFVIRCLSEGGIYSPIKVKTYKTRTGRDKKTFDRYVADVSFEDKRGNWVDLGDALVSGGMASRVAK